MIKFIKNFLILLVLVALLILPYFVFAQDTGVKTPSKLLETIREGTGYKEASDTSMAELAGRIINGALSLLGIIFIILMIIAGINWMTAAGDEQKVTKAKDTIRRAIIGLIIVIGSWAIWAFIMYAFSV